jgi:hypothetical protein
MGFYPGVGVVASDRQEFISPLGGRAQSGARLAPLCARPLNE